MVKERGKKFSADWVFSAELYHLNSERGNLRVSWAAIQTSPNRVSLSWEEKKLASPPGFSAPPKCQGRKSVTYISRSKNLSIFSSAATGSPKSSFVASSLYRNTVEKRKEGQGKMKKFIRVEVSCWANEDFLENITFLIASQVHTQQQNTTNSAFHLVQYSSRFS